MPEGAGADVLLGDGQAIDKTTALHPDIQRPYFREPHFMLYQHAGAGGIIVRGGSGENNKVNVCHGDSRRLQGLFGCRYRQIGRSLARLGEPPGLDAGAGPDPFVGSVHQAGQLSIGDHPFRNVGTQPGNIGPGHCSFSNFISFIRSCTRRFPRH